ncbi:EamA family transporter [Pedobacter mendelii]|uniref:Threonine transporter RhtB n=1 Tax=Pedobacter mendelii TaxID=1908240 RepID=A0ABQ2BMD0_9SPHI|nr:DMT family transporter [Pedobacter mendelii]GGI29409.1 threonine transporter RhtB [Pedobacter mendelii]
MKNNKGISIPPVPAVILSIVSVQGGAAIAKGIFPVIGAAATSSLRILLSAIILILFNRPNLKNLTPQQWKTVSLYGITLGLMNLIFYKAIERIPLGLGVTLEFIGPLVLAISGSKKALDFLWVVLAAIGIAFIAPWKSNGLDLVGVILALIAGIFWAAYIVLGGRISKIMDGGKAVTIGMMFASAVIIPFALADGILVNITPKIFMAGLALALLSSAIPFTLEMKALKKMPAKTFSILMSLEPAAGALSGLIFLNEYLSVYEWIAVVLVIIASAGATITRKRQERVIV